jgi:5-methylcytosine-specific restriction endonuclease McrA
LKELIALSVATASAAPGTFPALVLNADFRPLSYYPLSLWGWQDTVKAVFLDRVNIVSEYERLVHSPSFEMKLPSVVSLKTYVRPALYPAFTRFNVFLRDKFTCQYCGDFLKFFLKALSLSRNCLKKQITTLRQAKKLKPRRKVQEGAPMERAIGPPDKRREMAG